MIRYVKSATVPSSLARGVTANAANCAAYDANRVAYRDGTRRFDITSRIYGTKVVKRQLKADQHEKCAFCEAIFDANVSGDVEHFRPAGAIDAAAGKLLPGYYWLGYSWSNLSYACPDCNEYRKRSRFPLVDESQRARDHHHSIANEEALLLDPYGGLDPRDHIVFRGEAPIHNSPKGEATIEILRLDRTTLARDRYRHLRIYSIMYKSLLVLRAQAAPDAEVTELIRCIEAQLAEAVTPRAKFSAATADHLAALAAGKNYLPAQEPT